MALESFPSHTTKPLAVLSFDFGTQRIGVAFGQSISGTARPVCVLKAKDGIPDWEQVGRVIADWSPDVLVIGLPYNLDGTESELLKRAAIEQVMEETGSMNKKSGIDDIAAQIILENWFSEFKQQVENTK